MATLLLWRPLAQVQQRGTCADRPAGSSNGHGDYAATTHTIAQPTQANGKGELSTGRESGGMTLTLQIGMEDAFLRTDDF